MIFAVKLLVLTRLLSALAVISLALPATAAVAQDTNTELRVKKLEAEMRAVQRKVFPGGSDRFFEPEIETQTQRTQTRGSSADGAVSDLLARVDALEAQLANLTSQTEENNFKLGQMESRLAALEASSVSEASTTSPAGSNGISEGPADSEEIIDSGTAGGEPAQSRVEQVAAIVKPDTGNAGEDEYIYGYRLWEAEFYPEAQQQLKKTVDSYSSHSRNSHARNLLGRAYLDGGKLNLAAATFLANYQQKSDGARAPDSLYFLGLTMAQLKDNTKACAAFDELAAAYPETASGRLANDLAAGRSAASCK